MNITTVVGLSAAMGLASGCDSKINQCNRLIEVINNEQAPIKEMDKQDNDPESFKKLADVLDGVAGTVRGVEVKEEELQKFRDDYATMASELATSSREAAEALGGTDMKKTTEAIKKMQSFESRESELVGNINKYCSGS
ncbi:MAG: hypothetical protein AAF715_08215 [Myxococcota bacterium]